MVDPTQVAMARKEMARRELARRASTQATPKQDNRMGEMAMQAVFPGAAAIKPGMAVAKGYGQLRESISEPLSHIVPEGGPKFPTSVPNPMFPQTQIPTGEYTGREAVKELAGMGVDQFATLGLGKLAPMAAKFTDKNLTSLLRRVAGQSSSDIKLGRELMREGGVGAVLSKQKAKPAYLGREIAPKAADVAAGRVKSMNPNAMREIGIPTEDVQLAQDLKGKFGLQEFPTKSAADDFYSNVINSAPDDVQIPTENLKQVVSSPDIQIDKQAKRYIEQFIGRSRMNPAGTLDEVPLSKTEYQNIRGMLNNIDPQGETPAIQAIKQALDSDAEKVIPGIAEAKGRFQLSRQTPKAEVFLDKARADEEMGRRLSQSQSPENVQVGESLQRLLGPEGDPLIKQVQGQRLAKQWYSDETSGRSMNPRANPILEAIKELAKPIPRGYEKMRAGTVNFFAGKKSPTPRVEIPSVTSSQGPHVPPAYSPKPPVNVPGRVSYGNPNQPWQPSPEPTPPYGMPYKKPSGAKPFEYEPTPEGTPYGKDLPYKKPSIKMKDIVKRRKK